MHNSASAIGASAVCASVVMCKHSTASTTYSTLLYMSSEDDAAIDDVL
jgi:hypothetical protein